MSVVIIALRCTYCSRHLPPTELMQWQHGKLMCPRCYEAHHKALRTLFEGVPPDCCAFCNLSYEILSNLQGGATVRMYVIPVDGIYALACPTCKTEYCLKRKDLYGGTQFGQELNL